MMPESSSAPASGPLTAETRARLREMDPPFAPVIEALTENPWSRGVLPIQTVELVALAVNAACTNLNAEGVRQHIRGALKAGVTRAEILMVLKMASLLSIHTCSLAAPILLEEAQAAGIALGAATAGPTPVCDSMKAAGQWNAAWEPFFQLDPHWTESFIAAGAPVYLGRVFSPKVAELLSIAFDASITHMYAPGTRRHIRNALHAGASVEEIMEVLKICVAEGSQALNLGVSVLAEESPCS
ncbi:MAG: carboxymuconolactone decarboxylase family protein [Verrucomicrobia bacterium]|nr:carboxymuconolactone decarboxylase family protein [Verrucomicrobiota bacterium]